MEDRESKSERVCYFVMLNSVNNTTQSRHLPFVYPFLLYGARGTLNRLPDGRTKALAASRRVGQLGRLLLWRRPIELALHFPAR